MTDNEILKVAECCIQSQSKADCFRLDCPAATAGGDNCRIWELTDDDSDNAVLNQIIKELVTVINRKNADIEVATETIKSAIAKQKTIQKTLDENLQSQKTVQEYIIALKKQLAKNTTKYVPLENITFGCDLSITSIKTEILDEAAEMLNERFKSYMGLEILFKKDFIEVMKELREGEDS